jgi:hypothetical protein
VAFPVEQAVELHAHVAQPLGRLAGPPLAVFVVLPVDEQALHDHREVRAQGRTALELGQHPVAPFSHPQVDALHEIVRIVGGEAA